MQAITLLTGIAVPLDLVNVDTDQIIPGRFLALPRSEQVSGMFRDLRQDESGAPRPDLPLNRREYHGASILVANENFGCGSSRETAVTVMVDNGIRAVIAPSFGDIFYNNCFQNGVLPIRLPRELVTALRSRLVEQPGSKVSIDLFKQVVTTLDGAAIPFEIDGFRKECLIHGTDTLGMALALESKIAAYESRNTES